jgi:pilus assembly protein FimV
MFNKGTIVHSSKLKYIAFALSLAFTPIPAFSAGLGKLNVLSGLGEPLRADIELLSVTPEELSTITAVIANNEAYENQGIDKPASHNDIKIEVGKNTRGAPILKLKSNQPITDAFLDMLIQVDWSSGRLLREYTLLLDPPGYTGEVSDTSQTSGSTQLPLSSATTTQTPIASSQDNPTATTGSAKGIKKSKRSKAPAKSEPETLPEIVTVDGQEYTTQKGDTLAKIARDMKPDGVSLDQMLVGLYQANPNAFDGKNMNRLKVGQIIKAPTEESFGAISKKSASKQVRVHSANWTAYKNKLAGIVAESVPQDTETATQSSKGKVTAAEDKATVPENGPKNVVKLSAGESLAGADKTLQDKVSALQEEAIAKENALKEAESRTADLEKQISEMKKLLALKNDAMAKAQQEATVANNQEANKEPANSQATEPVDAKPAEETKATAEVKPEQAAPAKAQQAEVKTTEPKAEPAKPAVKPMDDFVVEEPSFFGGLTENLDLNTLGLGGAALALIGGGWLFLRNKRKKNLASFEEGIMTSGGLKANTVFGNTAGGTVDTGDTSFLTDFSQSTNSGMIDAHDVDPIAEAEVYMAYGRDAQAEEILKDAIVKEPKRYELHLKLLEIYQSNGNNSAFEAISGELYTTLGAADPVWSKVAQLGVKLDPSNPLYAQAANTVSETVTEAPKLSAADKDEFFAGLEQSTTLDMPVMADDDAPTKLSDAIGQPEPVAEEISSTMDVGSLDFDLNPPTLEDTPVIANAEVVQFTKESITLDAPSIFAEPLVLDTDQAATLDLPAEADSSALNLDTSELSDFDISKLDVPTIDFPTFETEAEQLPDLDVAQSMESSLPALDDEKLLSKTSGDVSFGNDLNVSDDEANKSLEIDMSQTPNFGFTEISLDLDETNLDSVPSLSAGGSEPEEVETKLDLVMAYLDMEDKIGAKELLEEVMKEGGENQRKRAAEILEKIA